MSTHVKAITAIIVLILALIGGLYLSGWLTLFLLGLHQVKLDWSTYWQYWHALGLPQVAPYTGRIKIAGGVGFGLPLLLWLGVLYLLAAQRSAPSLHGDARFATAGDLKKADLLGSSPTGIVVGKWGNQLIRLPGQQFVILAAPTRSGKGVGIVIPNLLEYQGSVVVLDIKQENFELTSGWRKSQGQEIYLFNPFAEDRRTHRWNPLSYVSNDAAFRISDIQAIAAMLYPDMNGQEKFWISHARNAFTAFALYLFERIDDCNRRLRTKDPVQTPTLGQIYKVSTGEGGDLKEYLQGLAKASFLSDNARTAFANLLSQEKETFASIIGSFKEPLNAWLNPVLDAATSADDFWLTDVRKKKMTIYIGIQPGKLAESRLIVNLFFSQLINVNTKELPQSNKDLQYPCLLLMDEFTSIGRVDILSKAVAYMAGYNLRLLPIIQSMAQLDSVYGHEEARTLITNHALQILYAPREQQDANDYSEMLGYTTLRQEHRTRGRETTRSDSEERRALMLPQELKALGVDKEVFLYEGIAHPVKCDKIRYYQDKRFTQRLLPPVKIAQLRLGEPDAAEPPQTPARRLSQPGQREPQPESEPEPVPPSYPQRQPQTRPLQPQGQAQPEQRQYGLGRPLTPAEQKTIAQSEPPDAYPPPPQFEPVMLKFKSWEQPKPQRTLPPYIRPPGAVPYKEPESKLPRWHHWREPSAPPGAPPPDFGHFWDIYPKPPEGLVSPYSPEAPIEALLHGPRVRVIMGRLAIDEYLPDEGAHLSGLMPIHRNSYDHAHERDLLRQLKLANELTEKEYGPRPLYTPPPRPKRKPDLSRFRKKPPRTDIPEQTQADIPEQSDVRPDPVFDTVTYEQENEMNIKQMATAAALTMAVSTSFATDCNTQPCDKNTPEHLNAAPAAHATTLTKDDLQVFAVGGKKILDAQIGDLIGNGQPGALVVLETPTTSRVLGEGQPRTVLLVLRDRDGKLRAVAQNDKIVPCKNCGGLLGDPYGYSKIKLGQFTIITEGGSRVRWGNEYTFKYDPLRKDWLVIKVDRTAYDSATEDLRQLMLTPKNFGVVSFQDFDPGTLPEARIP